MRPMAQLTKKAFEDLFREEVLPHVIERYEQDGIPDKPARREAWNNTVDSYIRDRILPESAGNWGHPRWLETWRPAQRHSRRSHATKKTPAQLQREIAGALTSKGGRAADLIANYPPWTSTYSNEDSDRAVGLAYRLTDLDRAEGRPAPAVGFSKRRLEEATRAVREANRYSATSSHASRSATKGGRSHATIQNYGTANFLVTVGGLSYRVSIERDRSRGGYAAKLISEGIGTLMEPNGKTPGEALDVLVRELRAGDKTDQQLANRIAQFYWGET
jgi:hypothetical protein